MSADRLSGRMIIAAILCAMLMMSRDVLCAPAPGDEAGGLKVALEVTPTDWRPNAKVEFACTVTNATGQAVRLAAWGLDLGQALDIRRADGKPIECESAREGSARIPRSAFETVAPGASVRFLLKGRITGDRVLIVNELLGGTWQWPLPSGSLSVRAVFQRSENDPWAKRLLRGGYWTGKAVSSAVRVVMSDVALEPGEAVGDLRLKLSAERTDLKMVAVESAAGTTYRVEPTKIELSFINEGTEPLKVNTRDLLTALVRFEVEGPDEASVRVTRADLAKGRVEGPPADVVLLEANTGWTCQFQPLFPGRIGATTYEFLKPGQYRVTAVYSSNGGGFWAGLVQSNVLLLNVVGGPTPAGAPVKGLKLELASDKDEIALGGEPAKLTVTFTNVSGQPVKLNAYELEWQCLRLEVRAGAGGALVVPKDIRPLIKRATLAPAQDDFPTLEPGKSWSYKWKPRFPGDFDGSSYDIKEPGEYRLKVTYENRQAPAGEEFHPFVKGSWTGVVASNEIAVKVIAGRP